MKETKYIEFKEAVTNTFIKTVIAFANFSTGDIYFGIKDNGDIVGIEYPEEVCLTIENKINDMVNPKPDFTFKIDKRTNVVQLTVKEGLFKPYLYKGKAYKRSGTSTVELDKIELKRLILEGENLYFEELPVDSTNLSFEYLFRALNEKLLVKNQTKDVLKTLGLLNREDKFNNAAALLSDKNDFPGIDVVRFGRNISEIIFRKTFSGISILEQLGQVENIFDMYYRLEEIQGMKRREKYLIPKEAFRETVANALVHRTWDVNSHIRIAMYEDKIEIYSPGGLPVGLTKEEYISGYVSNLRNPLIANVFFRLDIIEKFGTGIMRIKKAYSDIKHQPIFEVKDNSILTILPTTNKRDNLTEEQKQIIDCLENGMVMASSQISKITGFGKDKTVNLLKKLQEKNYVEKTGAGRGTRYRLV